MPGPDDDEIGRSRFPRYEFVGEFQRGAPFDLLEALALIAELLAHLVEAGALLPRDVLSRFAVDGDACADESRPRRQPGNPDERGLKTICQGQRDLDSLLAVALDVECTIIAA